LLLSADIRAAAAHARFGLPEVRYGVYPFGGAALRLRQQIGHVHAMDLLLTGRLIDAEEAARIGLVNRVLPQEELMSWAIHTAETIAVNSPAAVQAVKEQITATDDALNHPRETVEQELGDRVRASPDFAEGVSASQDRVQDLMGRSEGKPLDRARIISPFNASVRYSAYSALRILAAHQRRHLWQATRVRAELPRASWS